MSPNGLIAFARPFPNFYFVRLKIVVVIVFVVVIESTTMDDNENDNGHTNRECNKVELVRASLNYIGLPDDQGDHGGNQFRALL